MKKPIPVLEFTADPVTSDGVKPEPVILETLVRDATPLKIAARANDLATAGQSRILYASTQLYWQKRLTKALGAGFAFGVLLASVTALIIN